MSSPHSAPAGGSLWKYENGGWTLVSSGCGMGGTATEPNVPDPEEGKEYDGGCQSNAPEC